MIDVTCAIIRNDDDEVLVVQRGADSDHPLRWEFPGGKIDEGETAEECIVREIREELSIDIVICSRQGTVEYDYGKKQIRLHPFVCDTLDEIPFLTEHVAFKWLDDDRLLSPDYSEADLLVAAAYLESRGKINKHTEISANESVGPPDGEDVDDAELQRMINHIIRIKEVEWLAVSALENRAVFKKLIEYSYSSDKTLAFRASWVLTKVCDRHPGIIYPFLSDIIRSLPEIDNESALRSFLRIISLSDPGQINEKQHGLLAEFCFGQLRSGFSAIAIKAYCMEILWKLTVIYPPMANELSETLRVVIEDSKGGILARGRQILKKIAERPIGT